MNIQDYYGNSNNHSFCTNMTAPHFRKNININDILGDYCLTLVDTLDTLAVLGNATEFRRAVELVVANVSFDKDNVVQVFEVNIR